MKPTIYDQHDKAFKNVSAYVVCKNGDRVATISFKSPSDGAGRLYAYVHWIGVEMVRGYANGYGYDKKSAAIEDAVARIKSRGKEDDLKAFIAALVDVGGSYWDRRLMDAGFNVFQAV